MFYNNTEQESIFSLSVLWAGFEPALLSEMDFNSIAAAISPPEHLEDPYNFLYGHSVVIMNMWAMRDLNPQPLPYEGIAKTIMLMAQY
jgi:hypothetical protein